MQFTRKSILHEVEVHITLLAWKNLKMIFFSSSEGLKTRFLPVSIRLIILAELENEIGQANYKLI
jgi:hypothetical protein